ncbi:uncharacterized protein LOC121384210 [Gigantopelta aegis]|uniref:uncharacterized protein LOC121384210 n=1 Tax=Gigantopelta aegis TaxID=1735272 RepID=UPI001B888F36|nr:uncharacterized protein LOC121384210 [Gigantopelta aegis]
MEKQYTVKFFTSFVDHLQELCRTSFQFDQTVEVSGYICIEVDNSKKERYVLSEVIHNYGNVVSESFCHKAFKTTTKSLQYGRPQPAHGKSFPFEKENNAHRLVDDGSSSYQRSRLKSRSRDEAMAGYAYSASPAHHNASKLHLHHRSPHPPDRGGDISVQHAVRATKEERSSHTQSCQYQSSSKLPSFAEMAGQPPNPKMARMSATTDWVGLVPSVTHLIPHQSLGNSTVGSASGIYTSSSNTAVEHSLPLMSPTLSRNQPQSSRTPERRSSGASSSAVSLGEESDRIIEIDLDEYEDDDLSHVNSNISSITGNPGHISQFRNSRDFAPDRPKTERFIQANIRYALNLITQFLEARGEKRQIHSIPPDELDSYLSVFYTTVRKSNGDEFQPTSFKTVQNHIDRYLRENKYPYSITKDSVFEQSQAAFRKKRDQLIQTGAGTSRSNPMKHGDVDVLFEKKQLGGHTPNSLINTMWFMNSAFFGISSHHEHHSLNWGDILLGRDPSGKECLTYICRTQPNKVLTIYAQPETPTKCFLSFYKQYMAARPQDMLGPHAPFYLAINSACTLDDGDDMGKVYKSERICPERLMNVVQMMIAADPDNQLSNYGIETVERGKQVRAGDNQPSNGSHQMNNERLQRERDSCQVDKERSSHLADNEGCQTDSANQQVAVGNEDRQTDSSDKQIGNERRQTDDHCPQVTNDDHQLMGGGTNIDCQQVTNDDPQYMDGGINIDCEGRKLDDDYPHVKSELEPVSFEMDSLSEDMDS